MPAEITLMNQSYMHHVVHLDSYNRLRDISVEY